MDESKILEIIYQYNKFWTTGRIDAGIERDLLGTCVRQLEAKETMVLKGVRRSGKSTLMAQMIRFLLDHGRHPAQILRVSLEEPLFAAATSIELLERIYRVYRERVYPEGRCYLFLDEIQNVPMCERWVRGRNETENIKIVITGSSSRLLTREAGTALTGRHLSFEVAPLCFAEFLRFKAMDVNGVDQYVAQKAMIRHLLSEFRTFGGFPEVVLRPDNPDKEMLLKQYFEDIVHRDVAARHDIRDILTLQNLAVFLLTTIGQLTSISNLKKNLNVSQDKVENYTSALLETYLVSRITKLEPSIKKNLRSRFKPYAVDTGLRNRVAFTFSEDSGWLAENMVHAHLKRRHEAIYYEANDRNVDFVVKEGLAVTRRIQVWYADPSSTVVPEREVAAFAAAGRTEGENLLITNDIAQTIALGKTEVRCVPLALFLLDMD